MNRCRLLLAVVVTALFMTACGGGGGFDPPPPPNSISAALTPAAVMVVQNGEAATATLHVTRESTGPLNITVSGLPSGVTMELAGGTSNDQNLSFSAVNTTQNNAGSHLGSITVTDGQATVRVPVTVSVAIAAAPTTVAEKTSKMFLSTSFQPADWSYQFFMTNRAQRLADLSQLGPRHINLQPMDGATEKLNPAQAEPLDFSKMDAIVQPVLAVTDQSPLLQIYAPTWMWVNGDPGQGMKDATFNQFADYSVMLLKYYNVPAGVTVNGTNYKSPSGQRIEWWGIFNEPNLTALTPQQYVQLYNLTAQKMLAVDPSIKLVAVELSDWGSEHTRYLPAFVQGVTQPVHALATHYYSTCNQRDTDQQVLNNTPYFADHVRYFSQQMATNPALANLPVWVTENNVNADFSNNGKSACNPSQNFVADARGSSAFFAGWRPTVFAQLMRAGAESLHHWDYNADQQFGHVDGSTGQKLLSYWLDYWLARYMTDEDGVEILPVQLSQNSTVEVLAIRKPYGAVTVMIANTAVKNTTDNNGTGAPRTVVIDTTQLGAFTSMSLKTIDATTNILLEPSVQFSNPATPQIPVALNGYGVTFVELTP